MDKENSELENRTAAVNEANTTADRGLQTADNESDDSLFVEMAKKKKKKKRKLIITIVIVAVVVLAALIIGVLVLRRNVRRSFTTSIGDVVSYDATVGNISTSVSGYGTLANDDEETITVPYGVEIEEVKLDATDTFKKGDVIATVDLASVMSTMSSTQEELDTLDDELESAEDDTVDAYISSGIKGRLKLLYATAGTDVVDCMYENGALAIISSDGYMAADIETTGVTAGEAVSVTREDGSVINGTVYTCIDGVATILVTDNGPRYGEKVTVSADGKDLGTAELYIHSPIRVTGLGGTVSYVYLEENAKVYNGTVIYSLTNTSYTANYELLIKQRAELEEDLLTLMDIYKNGAITAPYDGSISTVIWDEDTELEEDADIEVVTISPDVTMSTTINVDESNILSLEVGQTADVTISSISDDAFKGTVTSIDKTATTSSGVTRYTATVTIDKEANMLPGMTTSVVIRITGVDNAVIIPVDALHQTSSTSFVYTSFDEETQQYGGMVEVTTGISNSSYVEITSGLKEGDTVYYVETEDSFFSSMMGNWGGGDMGGGDFGGGGMPSGGGNMGGGMPSGGGGGGMPGGGMR